MKEPSAKQRILRSAASLFPDGSVNSTGVDALIARAGVAKATFYRQFPSKAHLVAAWLRTPEARWLDHVVPELERRTADPVERLVTFWDVLGEWAVEDGFRGCPYLNTLVEIGDPAHPALEEIQAFIAEVQAYLTETARAAGLADPALVGRELRYLAMGGLSAVRLERSTVPLEFARGMAAALIDSSFGTATRSARPLDDDLAG